MQDESRSSAAAGEPLTEVTFYILLSLAAEPKHGYAIMKDVQALSAGRVTLSTGTLYGALKRLLDQGCIERVESRSSEPAPRDAKAYAITPHGRALVRGETARLAALLRVARRTLGDVRA